MNEETELGEMRVAFFRRDRRSVCAAREFTRAVMKSWRRRAREDDVLLCVSELATNALLYGVPPGRGFSVRLCLLDGTLRLEVHDSGPGTVCLREPSTESESGRGLVLVSALADKWGVGERDPGKFVWCEFEG